MCAEDATAASEAIAIYVPRGLQTVIRSSALKIVELERGVVSSSLLLPSFLLPHFPQAGGNVEGEEGHLMSRVGPLVPFRRRKECNFFCPCNGVPATKKGYCSLTPSPLSAP